MTTKQKALGNQGEQIAVDFLQQQNFTILERQWHCSHGEIDIIAKKEASYIFIEVKTCRGTDPQSAFSQITPRKQQRFTHSVLQYLDDQQLGDVIWRIDAIGIAIPKNGKPIIKHVEDAFAW